MKKEKELLKQVRCIQKKIELFYLVNVLPKVISKKIRQTKHFRQWFDAPMNYVRMIELPLAIILMDLETNLKILDIASPKLLPLYLGTTGFSEIVISDANDYFVEDFEVYAKAFKFSPKLMVFDAVNIPFSNNLFDRVFSISVIEHIAGDGDCEIVKEVARILKPGGLFIVTCPASNSYREEWLKKKDFYWPSKNREDGRIFFQRAYDNIAIKNRFRDIRLQIEDIIFIAEKPIKEPKINENGRYLYNVYYLEELKLLTKLQHILQILRLPLLPYLTHRYYSYCCHYLTRNYNDTNIRQVAVKIRKTP